MNITVAEYAKKNKITENAVYNRIRRGTLDSIEIDGIKMVVDNNIDIKSSTTKKSVTKKSNLDINAEILKIKKDINIMKDNISKMSLRQQAIDIYNEVKTFFMKFFK